MFRPQMPTASLDRLTCSHNNAYYPHSHLNNMCKKYIKLLKQVKKKFLQKVAKALETISNDTSEQRVMNKTSEGEHYSEDERVFQRANAPPVTMTTNPTNPKTLFTKPCTHVCVTRNNTPGSLPVIINPEHQRCIPRRSQRLAKPNEEPILTINTPNSTRIPLHLPNIIAFNAVNKLMGAVYYGEQKVWYPGTFLRSSPNRQFTDYDCDIEHMCAGVTYPITTISEFTETWETAFGKEFGNQAQGDNKAGKKGTNTLFVMIHEQICNIPKDCTVAYGRIVIDYQPQTADPNRIRITAGGNLITDYPGEVTTCTADLTTAKILWNSVISTNRAHFMGIDIKSFFNTVELD
ncbi:hypothetical protein ACHAW6_009163 [Cyclotella cf. meneghiniana]